MHDSREQARRGYFAVREQHSSVCNNEEYGTRYKRSATPKGVAQPVEHVEHLALLKNLESIGCLWIRVYLPTRFRSF